jgi:hypothetical protein
MNRPTALDDAAQLRLMIRGCIEELLVARQSTREGGSTHRLVVTVEGSSRSIELLRTALREAAVTPAEIRVNGPVGPFAHVNISSQASVERPGAAEPRAAQVSETTKESERPATVTLSGVVTEAGLVALPAGTTRVSLAAGAILTPLARDRLRSRRIRAVRLDDA